MGRRTKDQEEQEAAERLQQAIACKQKHKLQDAPKILASCSLLGNKYGVGIGLYFQIIAWLRWLLFWLALCMVPFMIVVNTSRFTTPEFKGNATGPGMSMLPSFSILQSLTFAVMPDDEVDKGLLSWMNIQLPGFEGVFPIPRAFFLIWISLMDAGSMAVFSIACLVLYKLAARFSKAVDKATMEVADYTVVIKGLPETTPIDVGHHFSKWGRVMDVVMVKDFGPLLNLAATATNLEQQRKAEATKILHGKKAAARQKRIRKMEKKMASFMEQANKKLEGSGFGLKAVFVTFNTESQAAACMAACKRRWLSSWFMRKRDRFLGKYRFWVEAAQPPEDYIYENLSVPRMSRYIRMAIVRLVVFCILLATAGAVTKLMAMNMEAARSVVWDNAAMDSRIKLRMQYDPLNSTEAAMAPAAGNATLADIAAKMGDAAAQQLASTNYQEVSYCSVNLENRCSAGFSKLLGANVSMHAAERATWSDLTDSLLKRDTFLTQLAACTNPGSGCMNLAMCLPCHCSMLSKVAQANLADRDWVLATRQECGDFITTLDMHAYVMKGLISGVIVMLNLVLKSILQWLTEWEKHWTKSDKERAYAVLAFVSQLLNSVLVLLLVNAQSTAASAYINAALSKGSGSKYTSWGSGLILSGAYTDFSPSWFVDVGQSLQLLIIINAVVTGAFTLAMWLKRKLHQYCLSSCMKGASQSAWNAAWIGMEFVLDARVSDMMLGLWIILMFGSGIPSLYLWGLIWLLVVEFTDRWSLARICQIPARYGKSLPFLLLGVLPWAAATHCAFGLWMHTRFNAGHVGGEQISDLASSAGAGAVSLSNTYYFRRISQANGLPLLVLLIVHLTMHVFIRFMLYFFGKAFMAMCGCCCKEDHTSSLYEEVTYEAALLARHAQAGSGGQARSSLANQEVALAGAPTYRLPHHPRYSEIFSNPLYKPVWFKAFGRLRYTTLLSRPGGGFIIAPEPILDHDETDMQQSLASMSPDLQKMALKMADDSGIEGAGKRKRHSGLLTDELQAMRERSMSVQVAVLAGLGLESPRASFTGPNGTRPSSANFAAPLSPRTSMAAAGNVNSLLTAPAAMAAGIMAGAVAASGGSFSMFAPPGTPGKSRFSCPDDHHPGVYAAVAADLSGGAGADPRTAPNLAYMTSPTGQQQYWPGWQPQAGAAAAEQPQAWTVGADGYRVPLVPVMLRSGGFAYFPADSLPAGAVVATSAQVEAATAAVMPAFAAPVPAPGASEVPADGNLTLSGGFGPAYDNMQLPQVMPEQQSQQGAQQQQDMSQQDTRVNSTGAVPESVRQRAQLQSRAEAIFGQPMGPPQDMTAGTGADSIRSSAYFAFGLPLPPTDLAMSAQQAATTADGNAPAVVDNSAQQDSATCATAAGATQLGEAGWMGNAPSPAAFNLWEGVLAAAGGQAPVPGSPKNMPLETGQQSYPSMDAAATPRAAATGAAEGPFYPSIHISFAEPAQTYPNVHLTTVEMPACFAAPPAAATDTQAGSNFSTVLLASTRAAASSTLSPFKTDEELGLAPAPAPEQQQAWQQPPSSFDSQTAGWPAGSSTAVAAADAVAPAGVQATVDADVSTAPATATPEIVEPGSRMTEGTAASWPALQETTVSAESPAVTASGMVPEAPEASVSLQQEPVPSGVELAELGAEAAAALEAAAAATAAAASAAVTATAAGGTSQEAPCRDEQVHDEASSPKPKQHKSNKHHKHHDGRSSSSSSDSEDGSYAECASPRPQAAGEPAVGGGASAAGRESGGKKKKHKKAKKGKKGRKG